MTDKQKVLICGDVRGNFDAVFSRVTTLNKKSGPFDLLLCTGSFFRSSEDNLQPYKNGSKTVAVPTYVLGPCIPDHESLYPEEEGAELCPNVTYLGKRGLYTTSSGLKIAYLSGSESKDSKNSSASSFTAADCCAVRDACFRGQPEYRGIDILITSEWPADIQNLEEKKVDLGIASSSILVAWLAMHIRPRYHFVSSLNLYYERAPYRNHNSQHNSRELATRFIGVSPVGNEKKQKWLYACSLQSISKMRMMDLLQGTTDETLCPYDENLLAQKTPGNIEKYTGNGQFFYDMESSDNQGGFKRRHKGDGNQRERKKPEFDQGTCWFCLSSPTVEKHLVISVGEHCYLALAKGPLTPYHCLILPVAHHQATTQAPDEVNDEIKRFKTVLKDFFETMDELVVFYERNFKTSHLQIQCVPIPKRVEGELLELFQDEAGIQGVQLDPLPAHSDLCQIAAPGTPYFHVQLPSGEQLFTRTKHNFPLQFGRDVLSSTPILDCEDKADWRSCQLSKDLEIEYVQQFREKFEPYDFTVEE